MFMLTQVRYLVVWYTSYRCVTANFGASAVGASAERGAKQNPGRIKETTETLPRSEKVLKKIPRTSTVRQDRERGFSLILRFHSTNSPLSQKCSHLHAGLEL